MTSENQLTKFRAVSKMPMRTPFTRVPTPLHPWVHHIGPHQTFLMGFMKISQVTLVVAGGGNPDPRTTLPSYASDVKGSLHVDSSVL